MLKFGSKNDVNSVIKVSVRLLDDSEMVECDIQPHCKGKYLLDHVCNQLNLIEVDYFGLRFTDSHKIRHWLDPSKNIMKQLKALVLMSSSKIQTSTPSSSVFGSNSIPPTRSN
uniref:FERM domain-containing protein 3 n=1 Tax=Cacopsylla melanoneura TaxID=428564 RepID=A0A8D8T2A7_9HEMI